MISASIPPSSNTCTLPSAIGLARAGIKAKVFEAAVSDTFLSSHQTYVDQLHWQTKFDEIGAGVGLGPNAVRALKGLGILEHVLKVINIKDSVAQANFRFVQGSGSHEFVYEIPVASARIIHYGRIYTQESIGC